MKYVLFFLGITLSGSAAANWYYLDFRDEAKTQAEMCPDLGAKLTPQESLGHHVGMKNLKIHASYTFSDKSKMLALSTKNSIYVYASSLASCKALRDALNEIAKGEIFVAGMCDQPKKTGSIEMEIASSLVKHGNDRLKVGMQGKWGAVLELSQEDGRKAPISISVRKEDCLSISEVYEDKKASKNGNWYAVSQGRKKCIVSPMSPADRIEVIQEAGIKPNVREGRNGTNLVSVEISVTDGGDESKWVFWKDKLACENSIERTAIPDSYR